jgi:Ion channel/Ribbon-helix-helix protein, copG family
MSEMPSGSQRDPGAETAQTSAASAASARRTITIDVDRKLDERLGVLARWRGVSEEELIAEAIDTYSPVEPTARFWPALGIPGLLVALPLVLMFASPPIGRSGSVAAWTVFALAMLACCVGALELISTVLYAEWVVIKYGVTGLVSAAACGTVAVLSVFAYAYWLLGSLRPASFNLPLSRVDAIYFTLGTFTTTGTGRFVAQSSLAELLVSCQVVLGWGFVAVLVALLVPRVAAARKRLSNGRIIIRTESPD